MVFVMDKIKDQSCAIQPAFGFGAGGGGGGFNGLNFAFMLDQMINPDNLLPLVDEDDAQLDALTNFPPLNPANFPPFDVLNFNPFTNQQPQPLINNHSPLATEQSNQVTGNQQQQQPTIAQLVANAIQQHVAITTGNQQQQQQASVSDLLINAIQQAAFAAENQPQQPTVVGLVANAIQQHAATHNALLNNTASSGSNNAHQPQISLPDMVQIHEPIIPTGVVAQAIQFQVISETPGSLPISVTADQPQVFLSLPSNNGFGLQQYVIGSGQSSPLNMGTVNVGSTTNPSLSLSAQTEFLETMETFLLNNEQDTVPTDEDSISTISSVSSIQAPFSSPAYPFSPSASNEDVPSVASDIVIIDSAENSEDVDENQTNHTNVPN